MAQIPPALGLTRRPSDMAPPSIEQHGKSESQDGRSLTHSRGAAAQELLHRVALLRHRRQPAPCRRCAFRSQTCSLRKPPPPIQQCRRIHAPILTLHMLHCTIHTHVAPSPPTLATWIPHAACSHLHCSCIDDLIASQFFLFARPFNQHSE